MLELSVRRGAAEGTAQVPIPCLNRGLHREAEGGLPALWSRGNGCPAPLNSVFYSHASERVSRWLHPVEINKLASLLTFFLLEIHIAFQRAELYPSSRAGLGSHSIWGLGISL